MKVKVLLFALFREIAGQKEIEMEIEPGVTVALLQERLREAFPRLGDYEPLVAVNGKYAGAQDVLGQGDEVALLPPFSGGCSD